MINKFAKWYFNGNHQLWSARTCWIRRSRSHCLSNQLRRSQHLPKVLDWKKSQIYVKLLFVQNFVQIMFQGAGLKCLKQKRWQLEWDLSTRAATGVQINFPISLLWMCHLNSPNSNHPDALSVKSTWARSPAMGGQMGKYTAQCAIRSYKVLNQSRALLAPSGALYNMMCHIALLVRSSHSNTTPDCSF